MTDLQTPDAVELLQGLKASFNETAAGYDGQRKEDFMKHVALMDEVIAKVEAGEHKDATWALTGLRADFYDSAAWWDEYAGSLFQTLFDGDKDEDMAPTYRDFADKITNVVNALRHS